MKLWIDDLRPAPERWEWVKSSDEAIDWLITYPDLIDTVSFDHDLGGDDTTRPVVLWLCDPEHDWLHVTTCYVHTQNVVGREWLEGMINRYGPGVTR